MPWLNQIMTPTSCFGLTQRCTWSVPRSSTVASRQLFWGHVNIWSIRSLLQFLRLLISLLLSLLLSYFLSEKGWQLGFLAQQLISCHILFFFLLEWSLQKCLRLLRFKLDRDEIWQDCSTSEYTSIDGVWFLYDVILSKCQDGGHDVISQRTLLPPGKCMHRIYAATSASSWSIVHSYLFWDWVS